MTAESIEQEREAGSEVFLQCQRCAAEFELGTEACPVCCVPLSLVRRCPTCCRIVFARHKQCTHCHTALDRELPKIRSGSEELTYGDPASRGVGGYRRAVIMTLTTAVLLFLGIGVFQLMNPPDPPQVHAIARSYALHTVELRRAPSTGSAIVGRLATGTEVNLTGFRDLDKGQLWMILPLEDSVAYAPASDLAPPQAIDADAGADALRAYLMVLKSAKSVGAAMKAVDYYIQVFPGSERGAELRRILAKRLRTMSRHAGPAELALLRQANRQHKAINASASVAGVAEKTGLRIEGASKVESSKSSPNQMLVLWR